MLIKTLPVGQLETNCYVVTDEDSLDCAVIDPGDESGTILDYLEDNRLHCRAVLLTHAHFDHVGAANALLEATGARLYMCEKELELVKGGASGRFTVPEDVKYYWDGDTVEVGGLPEYQRIAPKIHALVPQYSLVGVLLSHDADFEIVESTETGISAHNGYTWQVLGTRFVRCADFAFRTRVYNDAIHGWADGLDLQQRQELTDAVFGALEATGAKTLTDLTEQKVRKALAAAKDLFGDEEQRELFMDSMELLFKEYAASARRALPLGRLRRRKKAQE